MAFWLLKSEPNSFSIDDLIQSPKQTTCWNGVRNYQARNMMRDEMKVGDLGFFYHSNCIVPAIMGIIEIVKLGYPDSSAFDEHSIYFDPKSTMEKPIWYMVDVHLVEKFKNAVSLEKMKLHPQLNNMWILRKGNRLSITPLTLEEWNIIKALT